MRLRREDDRLNLTAELSMDVETGKKVLTMTSQPKTGISFEDLFGAALTITVAGIPTALVTFITVMQDAPATPSFRATGWFGKNDTVVFEHIEAGDNVTESIGFK